MDTLRIFMVLPLPVSKFRNSAYATFENTEIELLYLWALIKENVPERRGLV
jgi:hypothetical protein